MPAGEVVEVRGCEARFVSRIEDRSARGSLVSAKLGCASGVGVGLEQGVEAVDEGGGTACVGD